MKMRAIVAMGLAAIAMVVLAMPAFAGSYELISKDPDVSVPSYSGVFGEVAVGGGGSMVAMLDCEPALRPYSHGPCRLYVADRTKGMLEEIAYPGSVETLWNIRVSDDGSVLAAWVKYSGWPSDEGILVHDILSNDAFIISGNGNFSSATTLALSGDGTKLATLGDPYYMGVPDSAGCTKLLVFSAVPSPGDWSCVRTYDGLSVDIGTYDMNGTRIGVAPGTYALNYDGSRILFTGAATGVSHNKVVKYSQLAVADLASDVTYLLDSARLAEWCYSGDKVMSKPLTWDGTGYSNSFTDKCDVYSYAAGGLSSAGTEAVYSLNGEINEWHVPGKHGDKPTSALGFGTLGMIDASGSAFLYLGGATSTDLILNAGGTETLVAGNVTSYAFDKGGNQAVFVTSDALVPEDTDALPDVYLFDVTAP